MNKEMPNKLPVIGFPASLTEQDMQQTTIGYNNSNDTSKRKTLYNQFQNLQKENLWD